MKILYYNINIKGCLNGVTVLVAKVFEKSVAADLARGSMCYVYEPEDEKKEIENFKG